MRSFGLLALFAITLGLILVAQADEASKEIPFDPEKIIFKGKSPTLGRIEVTCQQRANPPAQEVMLRVNRQNGKSKSTQDLFQVTTYNFCNSYKFKLGKESNLTLTAPAGERNDEPGATVTITFEWKKDLKKFEAGPKTSFSPFKNLQAKYRHILKTAAIPKAEKLIIANRKIVENYASVDSNETQAVCEDFHEAYKTYADNLYKQKDYLQSFDIYISLRQKFGDPQNIFYDPKNKEKSIVLVCQLENSNNDQSENHFYTFARRYLNKIEFVPTMLKRVETNLEINTEGSRELATQILKFASYTLKSAPVAYQLDHQIRLIELWGKLVNGNPENPDYNHLLDEDAHLVFLLAKTHSCAGIPSAVIKRMDLKNDNKQALKSMTPAAGDDFYDDKLEKSAMFEYRQYVMGRALLKKCDEIPQRVLDRYFKYIQDQPYQD